MKPGPKPNPVIEFPEPKWTDWVDCPTFGETLAMHMRRHGDSVRHLCKAISDGDLTLDCHALRHWIAGKASPNTVQSLSILHRIERRYRLPRDYFRTRLPHQSRATRGNVLEGVDPAMRRRLAWHLPDDFMQRTQAQQEEILQWVMTHIISGTTDYRRYQAAASKQRYGLRFRSIHNGRIVGVVRSIGEPQDDVSAELRAAKILAPMPLEKEMADLIRFKTSTLTAFGLPHGPHNVRDVLATHILKQTGSYEQASYAIQDTPEMVAQHYGRFLPQDKAALAAQILNRVWEAA